MKKGIIFTIDALFALSIFLVSALVLFSYFSGSPVSALVGSGIYTDNENLIRTADKAELFSSAVNLYQRNESEGANVIMSIILNQTVFPANMNIYIWNGTNLNEILSYGDYNFRQRIVVRKILVLTLTQNIMKTGNDVYVQANSSLSGRTLEVPVSVYNSGGTDLTNLDATLYVYNVSDDLQPWTITPNSQSISTIGPGATGTANFLVDIPSDAILNEYFVEVSVIGTGFEENATDPFNVIYYGLVEMVVGNE